MRQVVSVALEMLAEVFRKHDTNEDGVIDRDELRGALRHYGIFCSVEHAGLEIHAYHLRESNDADADTFTFAQFFSFLHTYDAHGLYIRKRKFFDLPRSLQIDVACRWCFVPCAVFLFGGQALLWFGLEQIDSGPAED